MRSRNVIFDLRVVLFGFWGCFEEITIYNKYPGMCEVD